MSPTTRPLPYLSFPADIERLYQRFMKVHLPEPQLDRNFHPRRHDISLPIACNTCIKLQHHGCVTNCPAEASEVTYVCSNWVSKANNETRRRSCPSSFQPPTLWATIIGGKGPVAVTAFDTLACGAEPVHGSVIGDAGKYGDAASKT